MDPESPRLRLSILGVVVVSLFGALFARLWYLQVATTDQSQVEATSNRSREVFEEAPRGRILDRWGQVLVDNRLSLVVTVNPNDLNASGRRDEVLLRLAQELTAAGQPAKVKAIEATLSDKQFNPLQPIPVAADVSPELQVTLAERAEDFPGVAVRRETVRTYPHGPLAAHVLGYTGRVSEAELEAKQGTPEAPKPNPKPYQPESNIGKTGVERSYEDDLRGTPGHCKVEVDAKGLPARRYDCVAPKPGNDLVLSLDLNVQRQAEFSLAAQLLSIRGQTTSDGSKVTSPAGSTMVMDPRNGQVLAMASFPTYDPSEFVNGIGQERFAQLRNAPDTPLTNRAIGGAYAPGSTYKLVTGDAALRQGLMRGDTPYQDTGVFKVCDGDEPTCTKRNAGGAVNGSVTMPRALTVSSDTYFYSLGFRFWQAGGEKANSIQDSARLYGFGAPTGVPLQGETDGLILTPESKKQLAEKYPNAYDPNWYGGTSVQMAIGQDVVLVSPIQLVSAYAAFAENGTRYQPQLAARVIPHKAKVEDTAATVRTIDPVVTGQIDLPPHIKDPMMAGLVDVTNRAAGGTAAAAFDGWDLRAFPLFSKTGTAEVDGKADNSLYVACGPVVDTRYCAVAVLESAGFGADAAGPVVRQVLAPLAQQAPVPPPDPDAERERLAEQQAAAAGARPPGKAD